VELDGGPRSIAIQHVVDAALDIHDEWHLNHHEVELFAQVLLDVVFNRKEGLHRLPSAQK
jgi:hypothetical protein